MTYTLADYVRDHGSAPRRYIPHDWDRTSYTGPDH